MPIVISKSSSCVKQLRHAQNPAEFKKVLPLEAFSTDLLVFLEFILLDYFNNNYYQNT